VDDWNTMLSLISLYQLKQLEVLSIYTLNLLARFLYSIYIIMSWFPSWFLKVYAKDILRQLPQILATYTSVLGNILKIDSTKKVCRKLQGKSVGTASWCTNVGNENGEVLTSVLTESEGLEGFRPMALGLIQRLIN